MLESLRSCTASQKNTKMVHSSTKGDDEALSADSNLSNDCDSFGGNSSKGLVLKKGPWTSAEDAILVDYVKSHGDGNWNSVQKHSGLSRCGKSCRLRWANHLRPNLKKGAFTPEEERLIIELHAKMGNKWARMAANLPGRTDNEIKNYWNTRIKRRHRAGLPLYPPELCSEENQQQLSSPGIYNRDKGYQNIFQSSVYETTPNIMFDSRNILPHPQQFPSISSIGSLIKGFGCPQFYSSVSQTVGLQKSAQELDGHMFDKSQNDYNKNKAFQSFNLGFPYEPDDTKRISPNVNQDIPFVSNSIFSASAPFGEKSELPSFQYQRTGLGFWDPAPEPLDSFVQSPRSGPPPTNCHSPRSSGLLEALLYESKALKKSENTFSDRATSSTFGLGEMRDGSALKTFSTEFKGHLDPIFQLGNSVGSVSDGFTHTCTIESSNIPARPVKSEVMDESWILDGEERRISDQFSFLRPDTILGSCWLEQSGSCSKPTQGSKTGTIEALPYEDLGSESNLSARTSALDSSWGLNSCSWNNMPPVCQMSEFP